MGTLTNKRILLGITGGIAAYKSADLVRRLRDAGAEVRVVMTRAAVEFITPLTLQAVSGHPVHLHFVDSEAETAMDHITLARWADAVLVAPASANFLARLAQGRADDLLSTVCLATASPVAVAPAMNRLMWENSATQSNLEIIRKHSVAVFGPASGEQACGESGDGRMLEPLELVALTGNLFRTGELDGLSVMVTAGPTWEAIDPVRGISNRSSGRMGYAVAEAAADAGARVLLISGPTSLPDPERIQVIRITSARDMRHAVLDHIHGKHIFISAAAVADYSPSTIATEKIKKGADTLTLELVKNPDILATVAELSPAPFTVGFAAETGDLENRARRKLTQKKVDLIAANIVGRKGIGIDAEENELLLVDRHGVMELPRQHKTLLARSLVSQITKKYHAKNKTQNTRRAHR